MECPYCQNEMELGKIKTRSAHSLSWHSDVNSKHKFKLFTIWDSYGFEKAKIDQVFYCSHCKVIIKKLNNLTND